MRFLITGNTGFKGTWLTLLLKEIGHEVYGLALPAHEKSLYREIDINKFLSEQVYLDIRRKKGIESYVNRINPDFIVHLAAQPLVIESYKNPRNTIETNVMGTFNILQSLKKNDSVQALLVVTTDKVYRNSEKIQGYEEEDPLGGHDPYSASKAMADILTQSWALSYPGRKIFVARAGNVIGGGDFGSDRILPDIYRAIQNNQTLQIRSPQSVRPWQHVLDCLNGYKSLINNYDSIPTASTWNFGPDPRSFKTVSEVVEFSSRYLNRDLLSRQQQTMNYYESSQLTLNSSKSNKILGWNNLLNFELTLELTLDWYYSFAQGKSANDLTLAQIKKFLDDFKS